MGLSYPLMIRPILSGINWLRQSEKARIMLMSSWQGSKVISQDSSGWIIWGLV
jgi:hypothetical protein